ncbi:MAG: FHA domain-containing protein [Proteobacteria bacterium]|nr:MAG: FHA domain-containing protein [Pseudomonadota bacterium]
MAAKLLVIAGPNRGATYFLEEGETSFGRGAEAQIVLGSSQVSKKHFSLVSQNRKLEFKDLGSSNGSFVNGVLIKKKLLKNGDRISAGPFVLEVVMPEAPAPAFTSPTAGYDSHVAAPTIDPGQFKLEDEAPKSLIGKYKKKFDDVFLPVLYDFYERQEFMSLLAVMFAVYSVINLGFSVYPVLQRSREEVLRQAEHQARYISNQVAYLNRQAILEGKEAALITEFAESEVNVKEVVVANLEGRIMAPGSRLNESYNNPYFVKYKNDLQRSQALWGKTKAVRVSDREEVYVFTPIMVLSKTKGINVPAAVATVIYSTATIALDSGTIMSVYLEALFWSGFLGVIFLYLLYHVTHRPIEKLTDDMDKVLKGEGDSVEKKYKNEIIDKLVDTVNSALSRIPRDGNSGQDDGNAGGDTERLIIDNMMQTVEFLSQNSKHPMMLLDTENRVKMVSETFEELTGIRGAVGEVIDSVSRDESFPAIVKELIGKSQEAGNSGASEPYDFNAGTHNIRCLMLAGMPGRAEAYLFLFEKEE